jgi:hypothetical protein
MGDPLRSLFERAPGVLVAGRWRALGGTVETLAQALRCDEATALRVGLCLTPWPGCDLDAWSARVAGRFGVDRERVWLLGWTLSEGAP